MTKKLTLVVAAGLAMVGGVSYIAGSQNANVAAFRESNSMKSRLISEYETKIQDLTSRLSANERLLQQAETELARSAVPRITSPTNEIPLSSNDFIGVWVKAAEEYDFDRSGILDEKEIEKYMADFERITSMGKGATPLLDSAVKEYNSRKR